MKETLHSPQDMLHEDWVQGLCYVSLHCRWKILIDIDCLRALSLPSPLPPPGAECCYLEGGLSDNVLVVSQQAQQCITYLYVPAQVDADLYKGSCILTHWLLNLLTSDVIVVINDLFVSLNPDFLLQVTRYHHHDEKESSQRACLF